MNRSNWLFLATLLFCTHLSAQHTYRLGWMPQVNLNVRLPDDWRINTKVESRPFLSTGTFGEDASSFDYALTDIALLAARKLSANRTLSAGYLIRFTTDDIRHRLIQQFSLVSPLVSLRLGHRFAADQTFVPDEPMELRLRYRLSLELPLNGQSVDPGEAYLKLSHEQLHAFQSVDYDLEFRFVPILGYVLTDNNKLETGLDYRLDSFLEDGARSSFWWRVGWFRAW